MWNLCIISNDFRIFYALKTLEIRKNPESSHASIYHDWQHYTILQKNILAHHICWAIKWHLLLLYEITNGRYFIDTSATSSAVSDEIFGKMTTFPHRNGKVITVAALVFTGDVEACLQASTSPVNTRAVTLTTLMFQCIPEWLKVSKWIAWNMRNW